MLEDTRSQTTGFNWEILKSSGCGQTPDTAHSNAEEGTNSKELRKGADKTNPEFEDGDDNEVEYKRPFAAVSIREDAKYNLNDGTYQVHATIEAHEYLTAPTERSRSVNVIAVVWDTAVNPLISVILEK